MKKICFLIIIFTVFLSIYPEGTSVLVWNINNSDNVEYDINIFSPIYENLNKYYEVTDFSDILDIYHIEFYEYVNQNSFDYLFIYDVNEDIIIIKNIDEKFRTKNEYTYIIDTINIFSIKYEIINKMRAIIDNSPVVSIYDEVIESEEFKSLDTNMKQYFINLMLYQIYDNEAEFYDSEKYFENTLFIDRESIKAVYFNDLNSILYVSDHYIGKSFEDSLKAWTLSDTFRDMLKYLENEIIYNFILYAIDKSNIFLFNTDEKYYKYINENLHEIVEETNEHYLSMWLEGFVQYSIENYPKDTMSIFEIMLPLLESGIEYNEFIEIFRK